MIDTCEPDRAVDAGAFNPPCSCAEEHLTENTDLASAVCDSEVRRLILDEATDVAAELPAGSCQGANLIAKSWTEVADGTYQCTLPPGSFIGGGGASGDEGGDGDGEEDGGNSSGDNNGTRSTPNSGVARNVLTLIFFAAICVIPFLLEMGIL